MNARLHRLKDHFVRWREWECNPVVVKELRQAVRSWAVTGVVFLFLGVLFCSALAYLVGESIGTNQEQWLGGRVFRAFLLILTVASVAFIPLYIGIRIAAERQESNLDLLYVTTLSPARIIRGKLFCGVYMTVLFFSACMPFMVFTNLLRGIDLPTIFFILTCLFIVVCVVIQAAIFLACVPVSRLLKILIAIFGLYCLLNLARFLTYAFDEMIRSGVGSLLATSDFWLGFATWSIALTALGFLLYFLSVALIAPASANRALPVRIYLTIAWVVGAGMAFFWTSRYHVGFPLMPWAVITFIVLSAALVVVVSNDDRLSRRVRRDIPAHPLARALAFLFFNGAAGGLLWAGLIVGTTFLATDLSLRAEVPGFPGLVSSGELETFESISGAVMLYVFAYALTGLFVHRKLWSRRPPRLAGILTVLLPGAWALLPTLGLFFWNRLSWSRLEDTQFGNVFNVFVVRNDFQRVGHVYCAGAWVVLMLFLNARWFVQQWKQFQPLRSQAAPPILTQTPTSPSTPAAP